MVPEAPVEAANLPMAHDVLSHAPEALMAPRACSTKTRRLVHQDTGFSVLPHLFLAVRAP